MQEVVYDFAMEARRAIDALRVDFPQDTIAAEEGYAGRVHLKVVSERFNGKSERYKQQYIWDLLNRRLGEDAQAVSLALAYGTDEL